MCKELHCQLSSNVSSNESIKINWADYTSCAPYRSCINSKCSLDTTIEPINGVWGEWTDYGTCSRSCGTGIEYRTRECIPPKLGGLWCGGESEEGRLCNTDKCEGPSSGQNDFRRAYSVLNSNLWHDIYLLIYCWLF